jgi:hypothetical protein
LDGIKFAAVSFFGLFGTAGGGFAFLMIGFVSAEIFVVG